MELYSSDLLDHKAFCPNYNDVAIRYDEKFSFIDLDPQVGDIFKIFIDVKYISYDYPPISNQKIYGCTFYTPSSDPAAIAIHTGCLFINPKMKQAPVRRFCSIKNAIEAMSACNCTDKGYTEITEQEYTKITKEKVFNYPLDLIIYGTILHIYVDYSPGYFPEASRNGLKSKESQNPESYCVRVIHSTLITMYDEKPTLVDSKDYKRQKAIIPKNIFSSSGEIQFTFEPKVFVQIFSRINVNRGMFRLYKLYFDVDRNRYEIFHNAKLNKFNVILDTLNDEEVHETLVENADISEFYASKNKIGVGNHTFTPVQTLFLSQISRKQASKT
ncbi:hypothetical protein M9Y10_017338 [Tritrichomonas musculus]|uniref:Uncharacterized protein n=1 Tax=Tritrichomonas musculus TaxID=1915356 RepID=A0ABR2HU62_9EUKA